MPLCGFNPKMIQGIAIFAQGLFEAVLARSRAEKLDIRVAFEKEVSEITLFLGALEDRYQELRRDRPDKVMTELVDWISYQNPVVTSSGPSGGNGERND